MNFLQPFARHMRVNLCRGDIGVAEQQLHHAQIRAVIDEMGGKRVPQCMRGNRRADAGSQRVAFDQMPEHLPRHRVAARGDE